MMDLEVNATKNFSRPRGIGEPNVFELDGDLALV